MRTAELSVRDPLVAQLYDEAGAARWEVSAQQFVGALRASLTKSGLRDGATEIEIERYLKSIHLTDLALACACADGHERAWEHFVTTYRPVLYRAAAAISGADSARDLADSIYAELFGLPGRGAERHSLLVYFHGRSSLATWLRAVLAQRYVDRLRVSRRLEPLEDDHVAPADPATADPERTRWQALLTDALRRAVEQLPDRDRLRLVCYYVEELTLAQIGRSLGEHEATVSRHLARTRGGLRRLVEQDLAGRHGLSAAAVAQCFESVVDDVGALDLVDVLAASPDRKKSVVSRSTEEGHASRAE